MSRRTLLTSAALAVFSGLPAFAEASQVCLVGPNGADVYVRNRSGERIAAVHSQTLADAKLGISADRETQVSIPSLHVSGLVLTRFVLDAENCQGLSSDEPQDDSTASSDEPQNPTPDNEPAPTHEDPVITPKSGEDPFGCFHKYSTGSTDASNCNRAALRSLSVSGRHTLGYDGARVQMFQYVDAITGDHGQKVVESVYSNDVLTIHSAGIPRDEFNTEHTWPQSFLKQYPSFNESRADLFHIFPVEIQINGARGNLPFVECGGEPTSEKGRVPEFCNGGFEAPEQHKGIVARAMFYMSVSYNMPIDAEQEAVLRKWNHDHPVTPNELARGRRIQEVQGNVNPFLEHPEWVDLVKDF